MQWLNIIRTVNSLVWKIQKQRLRRVMLLNNIDGFRCEEIGTVIAPVSKGRLIFEKKKKQIITRMKQWWEEREKLKNKNRRTIWKT